jgi:hypothetical protein
VLREEVSRRFVKGTPEMQSFIIKRAESLLKGCDYQIIEPIHNYGNYVEEWCKNGVSQIRVAYFFDTDTEPETPEFFGGTLYVNEEFIEFLMNLLQVRKKFILNTLEEWYDEKYSHKFGIEIGNPNVGIDDIGISDNDWKCS